MLKYFELGLIPLLQSVNNMHRVSATHAAMLLAAIGFMVKWLAHFLKQYASFHHWFEIFYMIIEVLWDVPFSINPKV